MTSFPFAHPRPSGILGPLHDKSGKRGLAELIVVDDEPDLRAMLSDA